MHDDDMTVGDVLDGLSLWDEHKPQSGEDWVKVAERFIADGCTAEDSSPLFAGLVEAVRQRDIYKTALLEARKERDDFIDGLSRALNKAGVPAMPSWQAAIDYLADQAAPPRQQRRTEDA